MALVFFLQLFASPLFAQSGGVTLSLPEITKLDAQHDVLFKQYLEDVEYCRKIVYSAYSKKTTKELAQSLVIYTYTPVYGDTLEQISARCNIPEDAFATLNHWESRPSLSPALPILLPSMPGIFIPEEPENDMERIILASRGENPGISITIVHRSGRQEHFSFIPGDSFTPTERNFFMNPGQFRFPLRSYRLTSAFGMRISPISGRPKTHDGLDLAAPQGTPVFAARDGIVTEIGSNAVYGRYIIITHNAKWTSLYGHLSAVDVRLNSQVKSGTIIGKVGSTGLSTGPHLHFELRQNGKPQDPRPILQQRGKD